MPRRYVNQLEHKETVNEVFVAGDKQLRPNRTEAVYKSFDNGDYLRVEATAQLYQGAMQLIATRLTKVDPGEVSEDDFTLLPVVEVDKLVARLGEILRGMTDPNLRNLAECFLLDEQFMAKFTRAPAGVKHHHAYHGGLLQHVVNLMEVVLRISPCYPQIDRDQLLTGAFIHDMGKIDELGYERELVYSDEGQLLGHLVMAVGVLDDKVREAERLSGEPIPEETVLRLKHMIVSHHGEYEFGSPKLPMTPEAVALYLLDNLDAKVNAFDQLIRDDPNVDSPWTHYHANLSRKLFKGKRKQS